jgi:hypothetical protein
MKLVVKRYLSEPISHWYTTKWADKLRTYSHMGRCLGGFLIFIRNLPKCFEFRRLVPKGLARMWRAHYNKAKEQ